MRTIYIADDNKEFDDEFECKRYEWLLKHPHLKDIKCYDKDGNLFADIMTMIPIIILLKSLFLQKSV